MRSCWYFGLAAALGIIMANVLRDRTRRTAHRAMAAVLTPFAIALHRLRLNSKLGIAYPWPAPTAAEVLANYTRGLVLFGRPGARWAPFEWRSFPMRAIITRETANVPKTLRRIQRRGGFEVRFGNDFEAIVNLCREGRDGWLTTGLVDIYRKIDELGYVVTVGTYREGRLVGGFWGIGIGRIFSIMSMFHRENHAGALAFAALVDIVSGDGDWSVIDCGVMGPNFARYGAREIPERQFCEIVWRSLRQPAGLTGEVTRCGRNAAAPGRRFATAPGAA